MAEEAYLQSMEVGYDAAWRNDWTAAIKAFTRAIQAKSDDAEAHIQLGVALLNADQVDNALKVLKRAHQLAPEDPVPLELSAEALEKMGRLQEAAQQYASVADNYLAQRDIDKAIANWKRATQLTPGLVSIHARLANAYEKIGDKKRAVREYLILAFNFKRIGDVDRAIKSVDRALKMDKRNPQALNMRQALLSNADVAMPRFEDDDEELAKKSSNDLAISDEPSRRDVGEADPLGPMGEAINNALVMLAGYVVESGLDTYGGEAMQAMELHRQGALPEAVAAYQRSAVGLRHPALKLNLGALLLLIDNPSEAVKHLGEAAVDPELSAGALHALGQSYYKMGDQKKASRYLIQSLRAVDTSLAADEEEIQELTNVYESLLSSLEGRTDEALAAVNERFVGLLQGKDWKQRIPETRRHLDETLRDEGGQGLVDFLVAKGSDSLPQAVSLIDRYIRQGLLTLAMDEAHRAVERSPSYLPIHVRMAEIMMKEGRVRQAINKYTIIARSYMVRDEPSRAASILSEVLELAPLDIEVRRSLIELLEQEERWEEALNNYVDLANTYQQLGDFDMARETYETAERIGRRIQIAPEVIAGIKHRIADIAQLRLNMRQAQKLYEEILEIVPTDEKALKSIVEIQFNQGNSSEAIKRLDVLLGIYSKNKLINKITQLLEELVRLYPNDTGLRSRLASIYKALNRKHDAIAQLDALGELQLDAGLHREAANTIRQIIEMQPDRVDEYKKLLSQLGG